MNYKMFFLNLLVYSPIIQANYFFRNTDDKTIIIKAEDQDHDVIIKQLLLAPNEELVFSRSYLKQQKIKKLSLFSKGYDDSQETWNKINIKTLSQEWTNHSIIFNLHGMELKTTNVEDYTDKHCNGINKPRTEEPMIIKRGLLSRGYFLRNINDQDILITAKDQNNRIIFKKAILKPNAEFYFSYAFFKKEEIQSISLKVLSNFCTIEDPHKKISLYTINLTPPTTIFDHQKIHNLAIGLNCFVSKHFIDASNTQLKSIETIYEQVNFTEFLKKTLLNKPRIIEPYVVKARLNEKEIVLSNQTQQPILLENKLSNIGRVMSL